MKKGCWGNEWSTGEYHTSSIFSCSRPFCWLVVKKEVLDNLQINLAHQRICEHCNANKDLMFGSQFILLKSTQNCKLLNPTWSFNIILPYYPNLLTPSHLICIKNTLFSCHIKQAVISQSLTGSAEIAAYNGNVSICMSLK